MRNRGNLLVLVFLCNQAMQTAIIKMCNACEKTIDEVKTLVQTKNKMITIDLVKLVSCVL